MTRKPDRCTLDVSVAAVHVCMIHIYTYISFFYEIKRDFYSHLSTVIIFYHCATQRETSITAEGVKNNFFVNVCLL